MVKNTIYREHIFLWSNKKPGSALIVTLLVMGVLLAYSVHALQSGMYLRNFAYNRALCVNQQHYQTVARNYVFLFCKQYHEQLCKETSVEIVIVPHHEHTYHLYITITPCHDSYCITTALKKESNTIVQEQIMLAYKLFKDRQ